MKKYLFLLAGLGCLAGAPSTADKPDLRVGRTATDRDIAKLNKQLRTKYKLNATIEVLARNSDNSIRHLKFSCHDETNLLPRDGCESTNFGVLLVPAPTERGECRCQIADAGTEDILPGGKKNKKPR
jgi:hypothetical protein